MHALFISTSSALSRAARWLFLATLIGIPWLFGGTREWTITTLQIALYAASGLWLVGMLGSNWMGGRKSPWGISPALIILSGIVALWGWSVTYNAQSFFDPYLLQFVPLPVTASSWPGTVDGEISQTSMNRISALLLALLFSSYLAYRAEWRRRLLAAIAIGGITTALFGLAQKISGMPLLFWEPERFGLNNFAMYRYHANAAAYLNLAWPICAALAVEAFRQKEAFLARALWLPGTIVILAGLGVNVSKGGHLIALLLLLLGTLAAFAAIRHEHKRHESGMLRYVPLIAAAAVGIGLVTLIGFDQGFRRWEEFFTNQASQAGRVWMAQACLDMVQDRPWFGFGPGSFAVVFPFYSHGYSDTLRGIWRYAHCDYLQKLVEWGIVGSTLWAGIFLGGIFRAFRRAFQRSYRSPDGAREGSLAPRLHDTAIFVSLTGVAVHAAFDFPLQIASIQLYVAALLGCAWRRRAASHHR